MWATYEIFKKTKLPKVKCNSTTCAVLLLA
jgi:hypothetical protein